MTIGRKVRLAIIFQINKPKRSPGAEYLSDLYTGLSVFAKY